MYNKTLCLWWLAAAKLSHRIHNTTTTSFVSAVLPHRTVKQGFSSVSTACSSLARWNGVLRTHPVRNRGRWHHTASPGLLTCKGLMLCNPSRIGLK
jgi:hypothetical protein